MRIEKIRGGGWMPFRDPFELELPAGPIAVVGETDGNPRRSNWSGKTALLESITWCLFGVHRKRLDDGVISEGRQDCVVELDLGGLVVTRSRSRGKATALSVVEGGGDALRGEAAQQRIVAALGHSLDDYLATGCIRQGEAEAIVAMRAAQRREVISGWLGLARWATAGESAARLARTAAERVLRARAGLIVARAGALSGAVFAELEGQLAAARVAAKDLRSRVAGAEVALRSARVYRDKTAGAASRNEERARLRAEAAVLREELPRRSAVQERVAVLEAEVAALAETAAKARDKAAELRGIASQGFDGVCPITCDGCPVAPQVEAHVRGASALTARRRADAETADAELRKAQQRLGEERRVLDELGRKAERYNVAARRLRELGAEEDAGGALQAAADVDQIESSCDADRRGVVEQERAIAGLERDFEQERRRADREAAAVTELGAAEREQRVTLLACRALGPRGVPARIARIGIGEVESQANALLAGTGLSLEFAWSRETQDPAPSCEDCGYSYPGKRDKVCPQCQAGRGRKVADDLEVLVDDGSGQQPEDARAKSGGARLLVGAAVRLAAASLLRGSRGSRVGWALVDEPFGPLDAEHREVMARTFLGMLGAAGFEQALVVSHDAALLDAAPHRIVVERRGQVSVPRVE